MPVDQQTNHPRAVLLAGVGCLVLAFGAPLLVPAIQDWCACGGASSAIQQAASTSVRPGSGSSTCPDGAPVAGVPDPVREPEARPGGTAPLRSTVDLGAGVTLRVTGVERLDGVAGGPGEIAGRPVRLTLELRNGSTEPVSLERVDVDVTSGPDGVPASRLSARGGRAFDGDVQPGRTATGVYVFTIPAATRDRIEITVGCTSGAPLVVLAEAVR